MEIYTHNTEWEEQEQLYKDYMWEKMKSKRQMLSVQKENSNLEPRSEI